MLSRCNSNDIDAITDFGSTGTISCGNIAPMKMNRNNNKIALAEVIMPIFITKNNSYLVQSNTNQMFSCKCLYVQTVLYLLQNNTKQ